MKWCLWQDWLREEILPQHSPSVSQSSLQSSINAWAEWKLTSHFFIIREIFARYGFWSVEVIQRFGCFDFLDPLQGACGILRLRANLCLEVHNPALKFRMVREFPQMHLRGRITRNWHATLSTSPDTRGMVSHRLKTTTVVQTFFLCFSRKAR